MRYLKNYIMNSLQFRRSQVCWEQSRARIDYIDLFRTIGILLMIMGHIPCFGFKFDKFIHIFHMPMFFFVSGYFHHQEKDFMQYTRKKLKTLLYPYIFFGAFYYFVWMVIYYPASNIKNLIHLFTWNTYLPEVGGALWFLTALLISDLIYMLVDVYIKNPTIKNIIVIILFIVGCNERYIFHRQLPLGMGASFVGCTYIHIAGIIKNKKENILNLKSKWIFILSIVGIVLYTINGYVNMRQSEYSNFIMFLGSSLIWIIVSALS